jgi:hypothetical protein
MRHTLAVVVAAAAVLAAVPASAEVRLTMNDGKVWLSAQGATLGQIMAEWARVGQTRVVNADRISGGLLTLELSDVPEAQALDILLRNAGGYLLAPRPTVSSAASVYDRILIFAVSSAPRPVAPPAQAVAAPPVFPQARIVPPRPPQPREEPESPVADQPAATPAAQTERPAFATFPPADQQPAATSGTTFPGMLTSPAGARTPGMLVPAPQPGSPGSDPNRPQ